MDLDRDEDLETTGVLVAVESEPEADFGSEQAAGRRGPAAAAAKAEAPDDADRGGREERAGEARGVADADADADAEADAEAVAAGDEE